MDYADQRSQAKSAARPRRRRNEHDVFYAGERLGIARQLTGMSQQRPADHLGVSFQAVQKYESGQNRLSAGRLVAARQVPDVGLAYFAKDKGTRAEDGGKPTSFSAHEIDLVPFYRALPTRHSAPVAPAGADDSAGCGVGRER
jgi:transcriptional regulator with XRE-family HTH domain